MPSPILARADALMQRRRASLSETEEIPVLTDTIDDDTDIPVLLDAETPPEALQPAPEPLAPTPARELIAPAEQAPDDPGNASLPIDQEFLIAALAERVQERLLAEIPRIVESTVRDFLAEQQAGDPQAGR